MDEPTPIRDTFRKTFTPIPPEPRPFAKLDSVTGAITAVGLFEKMAWQWDRYKYVALRGAWAIANRSPAMFIMALAAPINSFANRRGNTMVEKFGGKKMSAFLATTASGLIISLLVTFFGMPEDMAMELAGKIVTVGMTLIGVQGGADIITKGKTSTKVQADS